MTTARRHNASLGFTLPELLLFLVVVSVSLTTVIPIFDRTVKSSVPPADQLRALKLAQSQMDRILALKFDENTPTGGVPACGSTGGSSCAGITADSDLDDVGDYNGFSDSSNHSPYTVAATVVNDGAGVGLSPTQARRVTVTVTRGGTSLITLSAYKVNF